MTESTATQTVETLFADFAGCTVTIERVSAQAILRVAAREDVNRSLFADPEQEYNEAVQFYRSNGREKTIAELNRHDGPFAKGMDYVDLHDMNGVCGAHPKSPDLVGQNRLDVADIRGKHFIKEIVDAAKTHPDGWISVLHGEILIRDTN